MRLLACLIILAVALSGCDRPAGVQTTTVDGDPAVVQDRDRTTPAATPPAATPLDQHENQADIDITAGIRQGVLSTAGLSVSARNVNIITQAGRVTLTGPVDSAEEKQRIEEIATTVAGAGHVDNQLEIVHRR